MRRSTTPTSRPSETASSHARVVITPVKCAEYIQLDPDLRAWFEEHDKDYPALINLVLRKYVEIQTEMAE